MAMSPADVRTLKNVGLASVLVAISGLSCTLVINDHGTPNSP